MRRYSMRVHGISIRTRRFLIPLLVSAGTVVLATPTSAAATPEVGVGDVTLSEGDVGFTTARVTVTLSEPVGTDTFVQYTANTGSATAGSDYLARAGRVRIRAGKVFATIAVKVFADLTAEDDETIAVELLDAGGVTIADPTGVITIRDDEGAAPGRLAIGDASLREGDVATRSLRLSVNLDRSLPFDVSARFVVVGGSATTGVDVAARSGTVRVRAGRTQAVVSVKVISDRDNEADEQFVVSLTDPLGVVLADSAGVGTIVDDDAPVATAPTAPTITSAVAGPGIGALTVNWSAPADDGGSPVTGYDLEVDRPGGVIVGPYSPTTLGATITCGSPGITCGLRIRARNAVGDGAWSTVVSATTYRAPDAVADISAFGGNGSITATWDAPIDDGDFPLIDYRVERSVDGVDFTFVEFRTTRSVAVSCPGERATCTVRIRPRNAAGLGPASDVSATTWARPDPPRLESIRRIGDLVGLSWAPPIDDGGVDVFDYTGERSIDGGSTWVPVGSVRTTTPTCPIGTSCAFRVRAVNFVGASDPSNVLSVGP
jgi:Calx-beta domain